MITTTRRGFLQLGMTGSAALVIGSGVAGLTGCSKQQTPASGYKVLRDKDLYFLGAMAPAILTTGAYPGPLAGQARERLLKKLDSILVTLQEYSRGQLIMMFDLMHAAPTRLAVGAPWHPWEEATVEEADAFLNSWKNSPLQIKRMGYSGLCKLIAMSWYSQPEIFTVSGYPGAPQKIPMAVASAAPENA